MKEILKKYWGYGIVFLVLIICFEIFLKIEGIEQLDEIVNIYSSDKELIDSVGKIKNHEYYYNENDRRADTLDFEILLYSKSYRIKINGFLVGTEESRTYDPKKFNVIVTAKN